MAGEHWAAGAAGEHAPSDAYAYEHAGAGSDEGQVGGGGVSGSVSERAAVAVGTGEVGAVGGQEAVVPEGEGKTGDARGDRAGAAVGGATQEHHEPARASRGAGAEETPCAALPAAATVTDVTAADAVDSRAKGLPLLVPRRARAQSGAAACNAAGYAKSAAYVCMGVCIVCTCTDHFLQGATRPDMPTPLRTCVCVCASYVCTCICHFL